MALTLYRAVRQDKPRLREFWSDFAYGDGPTRVQLADPVMWAGISTWDDLAKAKDKAREWDQGPYLAALTIPDDANNVIARRTGRDPNHYSVMGTPAAIRSLITDVVPST